MSVPASESAGGALGEGWRGVLARGATRGDLCALPAPRAARSGPGERGRGAMRGAERPAGLVRPVHFCGPRRGPGRSWAP